MQASSHAPFSRLCFRLSPKCLLAPNVGILKSMFHPASCSALYQDSVKWTDAFSFVLSNRTCACNCVSCQGAHWPLMCHQHTYKRGKRDKRCASVLTLTHPIASVSSRMTHGDSSTPTHSSKQWATCCVLGMACIRRWAWQTCGWPSSAWLWVLLATPCLWATPQHWFNLWTHLDGSTRRRWVRVLCCRHCWFAICKQVLQGCCGTQDELISDGNHIFDLDNMSMFIVTCCGIYHENKKNIFMVS